MHLTYVTLHEVIWCMVVWCTQNAPRWQQFHVAPAMPSLQVHHVGEYLKKGYKKLFTRRGYCRWKDQSCRCQEGWAKEVRPQCLHVPKAAGKIITNTEKFLARIMLQNSPGNVQWNVRGKRGEGVSSHPHLPSTSLIHTIKHIYRTRIHNWRSNRTISRSI